MARLKQCFKCEKIKSVLEFYAHAQMKDGYLNKCKECARADSSRHRAGNLEAVRAYDRARARLPARAAAAAKIAAAWRQADRRRMVCHNAVARAIRSGSLEHRPCEWPGCSREDSYAHHESYDRPLDVVFYCQPHHKARHKQMKKEKIEP